HDVPGSPVRLAAACGQGAAGHLVVAGRRDRSGGAAARARDWAARALRQGEEPAQPALDIERAVRLVQLAQWCEDGWRQWFAATGIQPCEVFYEDLARDRLAVVNRVLEFLRLPQLDA